MGGADHLGQPIGLFSSGLWGPASCNGSLRFLTCQMNETGIQPMTTETISAEEALVYTMVMASAVDGQMPDEELAHIGDLVQSLPAFRAFESENLVTVSQACSTLLASEAGLDGALKLIRDSLPAKLHDTAYALAVEVASADLRLKPEELRFLSRLRDALSLDKLTCAAIERSAIARYRRI